LVAALSISFAGSLPVGTLNAGVSGLVIGGDRRGAFWFALGAILVEVSIVRVAVALTGSADRLWPQLSRWTPWLRGLACAVIFSLAFVNLWDASQMRQAAIALPVYRHSSFISGLLLSLLNPLHLPFWLGWTVVFRNRGWINGLAGEYNLFVIAIGVGTGLAFVLYGFAGQLLIPYLRIHGFVFNLAVGGALLVAGTMQLYTLLKRRSLQ
jgi:threonine/homoserine/homoserine lactone efflux protein